MTSVSPPAEAKPVGATARVRPVVALMRPSHWIKNSLVFAAPLFAARLTDPPVFFRTALAFAAFCAASSAAYVYNDWRDAERDRAHPIKATRPLASGSVDQRLALGFGAALAVAGLLLGLASGTLVAILVGAYLALMAMYSSWGRQHAPVDTLLIAAGFLIRAVAGAAAGQVSASPWFLALTILLALMLGFGKRRAEIALMGDEALFGRSSLAAYTLPMLDQILSVLAASTIVLYAIYSVSISDRIGSSDMILTWPMTLVGILRYLQVTHTTVRPPDELLVHDRVILVVAVSFVVAAAAILHFHTHLVGRVTLSAG